MRRVAALLAGLALAGCGEKSEPNLPAGPAEVTGEIDLPRAPAPPDAGTQGGHGGGGFRASTRRASFTFGGTVRPPAAEITVAAPARVSSDVRRDGARFEVELSSLARGENVVRLEGRAAGARPWEAGVTVVRR